MGTPKGLYGSCMYTANGILDLIYMDICVPKDKICRSQNELKTFNAVDSTGKTVEKCCCEPDLAIDPNPSLKPVLAPTCYFSPNSKTLARWSIVKHGDDLVCKANFTMHTVKYPSKNGEEIAYSCCKPDDVPIPTSPDKPGPGTFIAPFCSYRDDKSLRSTYMENCAPNLICRPQDAMVSKLANDPATGKQVDR